MNWTESLEMVRNGSHVPTPSLLDKFMDFRPVRIPFQILFAHVQFPCAHKCLEFIESLEDELAELGEVDKLESAVDRLRPAAYYAWAVSDKPSLDAYREATQAVTRYHETAAALRHYKRKLADLRSLIDFA